MQQFHDSFNMLVGTNNKELDWFDNPYVAINVYEMTEDWKPKLSPSVTMIKCKDE